MADIQEARVPDIGGHDNVPVIEVMIKPGDRVEKEQSLITLESDKATMEVPAPFAGTVKEVKLKVGDEVSEGAVIALIEADGAAGKPAAAPASAPAEAPKQAAPAPTKAAEPARSEAPKSTAGGVREARVPDIGGHEGVPVIEVLVKAGDTVTKDQGLVTLESDKATMEVPAPFAGTVKEVKLKVGDEVSEGALIALIEGADGGAAAPAPAAPAPARAEAPMAAEAPAPSRHAEPGHAPEGDVPPQARPPFDANIVMPGDAPYASPAVRAFARELGVDIHQVKGSARGGRIVREDISAYVKHALASGARPVSGGAVAAGGGLNLLPWPKVDFSKFGPVEEKPLSRIQKISGANLARNWAMIPHVTQHEDADITELEAFRKKLGEEVKSSKEGDLKITPLVFQMKAVVAALKEYPQFNASLDETGEKLILKKYFHIGIAVDTERGLLVPVIHDAGDLSLGGIARKIADLAERTRTNKVTPDELGGGTFTLTNTGSRGALFDTPIINQPQVAILGTGAVVKRPVVVQDAELGEVIAVRSMVYLAITYDHRIVDGADAARFLGTVKERLEAGQFHGDLGLA